MAQFTAYRNRDPRSKAEIPFLLNIQNDLLNDLGSRLVIPLQLRSTVSFRSLSKLTPRVLLEGKELVAMTPRLAGIDVKHLGEAVGSLAHQRADIVAALDLLISGF